MSAALANGVAIFATEWGTCDASGDSTLDLGETQAWLNFFAQHHVSDENWTVSDKSEEQNVCSLGEWSCHFCY